MSLCSLVDILRLVEAGGSFKLNILFSSSDNHTEVSSDTVCELMEPKDIIQDNLALDLHPLSSLWS